MVVLWTGKRYSPQIAMSITLPLTRYVKENLNGINLEPMLFTHPETSDGNMYKYSGIQFACWICVDNSFFVPKKEE